MILISSLSKQKNILLTYLVFFSFLCVSCVSFLMGEFSLQILDLPLFSWGFFCLFHHKMFFIFALTITLSIIIFSNYYMKQEEIFLFMNFLFLFFFFMILLVSSSNLYFMFLGWEGVGIMSFMLIGTFSSRGGAIFSSKKAVIYNRIGDFFFLFLIAGEFSTQNFLPSAFVFSEIGNSEKIYSFLFFLSCCLCIFVKSSQFFFNPWLTSAMEGPTPVSALLHSSTMVVAGVYFFFLVFSNISQNVEIVMFISFISCFTNFLVSTSALFHSDMKKVIALSTASQLSFMIFILSMGYPMLAFFHLISHGFFKALLFLGSGVAIHQMGDSQDIRKLNFSLSQSSFLKGIMLFSSLALMGLPFLGAFFSKHKILILLVYHSFNWSSLMFYLSSLSLTVAYGGRLFFSLFLGKPQQIFQSKSQLPNFELSLKSSLMVLIYLVFFFTWGVALFYKDFSTMVGNGEVFWLSLTIISMGIIIWMSSSTMKEGYMLFNFWFVGNWNRLMFFFLFKTPSFFISSHVENNLLTFFWKKSSLYCFFKESPSNYFFSSSLFNVTFYFFFFLILLILF